MHLRLVNTWNDPAWMAHICLSLRDFANLIGTKKSSFCFLCILANMCPFLVLLRALPDADSQVSSKEHVQECGDLVGHLETKSLANHYVPWIAIFPIHLQYRSLSYLKSHTIRESYHLYTSPKQNWQTFANSMGKAVLAIFTGAKVKTSPDMTIPTCNNNYPNKEGRQTNCLQDNPNVCHNVHFLSTT